jgi:hypothetical protein
MTFAGASDRDIRARAINDWRPGTFALRDAWFAVAHLPQVGEAPIRRMIHSQPCYLWRENGEVRAAEFPPSQLSARRAEATAFTGGAGTYPVELAYGFVWIWYGDPRNASIELIPNVPFLPRNRVAPDYLRGSYYYGATHELISENALDLTHINFIHRAAAGFDKSASDDVRVVSTSESITMIREVKQLAVPDFQRRLAAVTADHQDLYQITHIFLRSSSSLLYSRFEPGDASMPLFQGIVPESRGRTLLNYAYSPSDATPIAYSREWPRQAPVVADQDDGILWPQNPRYGEPSGATDRHTRFDAAGVEYRFRMSQLIERQRDGDFSYLPEDRPGNELSGHLGLRGTFSMPDGTPG